MNVSSSDVCKTKGRLMIMEEEELGNGGLVWLLAVSIKSDYGQTDECFPSTLYYDITIWKPFEKVSTNKVSFISRSHQKQDVHLPLSFSCVISLLWYVVLLICALERVGPGKSAIQI